MGLLLSANLQANRVQRLMADGIMDSFQVVMGSNVEKYRKNIRFARKCSFLSFMYDFAKFYTLSSSPSPSFSLFLSFSLSLSLSFSLFFSFFQILRKVVKFISALSNDVMCSCIPLSGIVFLEPSRKLFKKRHVTRVLLESMFNQCVQVYCFTNSISDFIS